MSLVAVVFLIVVFATLGALHLHLTAGMVSHALAVVQDAKAAPLARGAAELALLECAQRATLSSEARPGDVTLRVASDADLSPRGLVLISGGLDIGSPSEWRSYSLAGDGQTLQVRALNEFHPRGAAVVESRDIDGDGHVLSRAETALDDVAFAATVTDGAGNATDAAMPPDFVIVDGIASTARAQRITSIHVRVN
jgi:hypothetical protein